jgi:hypothetical protein
MFPLGNIVPDRFVAFERQPSKSYDVIPRFGRLEVYKLSFLPERGRLYVTLDHTGFDSGLDRSTLRLTQHLGGEVLIVDAAGRAGSLRGPRRVIFCAGPVLARVVWQARGRMSGTT